MEAMTLPIYLHWPLIHILNDLSIIEETTHISVNSNLRCAFFFAIFTTNLTVFHLSEEKAVERDEEQDEELTRAITWRPKAKTVFAQFSMESRFRFDIQIGYDTGT